MKAQGRANKKNRARVPLGMLLVAGVASASLSVFCFQTHMTHPGIFWLLSVMIGLAQLMPVDLARGGVRVVFALPFVAALAVFFGPAAALGGDLAGQAIGGLLGIRKREEPQRILANMSVCAISVLAGSTWMHLFSNFSVRQLLWGFGFIAGYGACNLVLITWMEARTNGRRWSRSEFGALGLTVRSIALYGLLGLAVTSLIAEKMWWLVPLSLIPVWALRTSLIYQTKLYDNYYGTIAALNMMLQRAHPYTHGHLERVAETAEEVAKRLGLGPARARMVREAAILHDIGKIAVDEEILDKPARLTNDELEHVRLHSTWGAEILSPVREFAVIVPWIRHHHERPDGGGYPDRLSDVEIPIESKIIAVVDAYDAMIGSEGPNGKRTYREPMTIPEALKELDRCSGTQFDFEVVRAFRNVVEAEVA